MTDESQKSTEARDAANGQALQGVAIEEPVAPQLSPVALEMPHIARALRHPNYRAFWAGNFLSNIGTWMQTVAQGWLVLELSNSAFWLGVVGFASSAPMLVFSLIGGVIADRVDRRRMLVRTQAAMMLFAFVMAALTWAGVINVPMIVLLAFATGVVMSLNMPSYQALVPQLVPKEDLVNAIGLSSAQFNMARILGPTLGGFAMAWLGAGTNFFLNGLSFMALIFVLLRMKLPPPTEDDGSATMWQRLEDGFRYVLDRREMASLLTGVGLASVFGISYITFVPYFARDVLGVGQRGLGLLMACSGVGSLGAALTIAYTGKVRRRGRLVAACGAVFYVAVMVFSLSKWVVLSGLMMLVAGYSVILMVATVNTLLQQLATDEMRGRVMSIYTASFLGFAPVGSLLAGSLAGAITAPYAIAGMASVALVASFFLYFARSELRRLD